MLQAVLFDLDGTLLQMDAKEFVNEYLKEISAATAALVEPEYFARALLASTHVMMQIRKQKKTNADVFWLDFRRRIGETTDDLKPLLDDFYANRFKKLSRVAKPNDNSYQAVQKALDLGLRIVLATNPVFPESAIRDRMDWAGVGEFPWDLVTSYENMHSSKPHPEYYLEIASQLKVNPKDCLMVGNEMENDIRPAAAVQMSTFFVTDCPINNNPDYFKADGSGNLDDFIIWLTDVMLKDRGNNNNRFSDHCCSRDPFYQ